MITPDYVLKNDKDTRRLVLLFHGYGANGADLLEMGHFWSPSLPLTTFIAPNGPEKWEMAPPGYPIGYQWFGLKDRDAESLERGEGMREGLDHARPLLKMFIQEQMKKYHVNEDHVVLVGFSQGAMLSLEMITEFPSLGGIISYSGAFYPPSHIQKGDYPPVLLVHGTHDSAVPYSLFKKAEKDLKALGVHVETTSCEGVDHTISIEGLQNGLDFIQRAFTKNLPISFISDNKQKGAK